MIEFGEVPRSYPAVRPMTEQERENALRDWGRAPFVNAIGDHPESVGNA